MSLLHVIELLGVAVFAVSGALAAGRKSLDLFGVIVVAAVTAIGGGTIRDLLMDNHPTFWIRDPGFLVAIIFAALLTLVYVRYRRPPVNALQIADALGLAMFSISGAQIAERAGLSGLIVVLMAVITGTAGGVLRDLLTHEMPMILRRGHLYATTVIAGATVYLLLQGAGVERAAAGLTGMAVIAAMRFAAIVWKVGLPVFSLPDEELGP